MFHKARLFLSNVNPTFLYRKTQFAKKQVNSLKFERLVLRFIPFFLIFAMPAFSFFGGIFSWGEFCATDYENDAVLHSQDIKMKCGISAYQIKNFTLFLFVFGVIVSIILHYGFISNRVRLIDLELLNLRSNPSDKANDPWLD